ncbi:MAG: hypothetical protein QOE38_1878 [Thermoleophilaceae bacterium]|nr:hypothetical protein [Thermoleophilaceae bacterium]
MARTVIGAVAAADVARGVVRAVAAADLARRVIRALRAADVARGVVRALATGNLTRGADHRRAQGRCCVVVGTVVVAVVTRTVIGAVPSDMAGRVVGSIAGDGDAAARYGSDRHRCNKYACNTRFHGSPWLSGLQGFIHRGSRWVPLSIGHWS